MNFQFLVLCSVILGNKYTLPDAASTTSPNTNMKNSIFNDLEDEDIPIFNYQNGDESRIVGGKQTTIDKFPHQVAFVTPVRGGNQFCGGFIISENYIISAAHCCLNDNVDPADIVVRAGSTYRENGTRIPIESVTRHPDYNEGARFNNDACVLKTVSPIEFTEVIKPIELPELGRQLVTGSKVDVSGWGRMRDGALTQPQRLYAVEIPVVDQMKCNQTYRFLTDNMFCAGNYRFGPQGTCQGDSGGAAVQDGMAVGIVSFGRICGRDPSVFANIAATQVRQFIQNQTGLEF